MQIRRAFLVMLAGASLFLVLFGPLDVSAAAAAKPWHGGAPAPREGSSRPGDLDDDCNDRRSDEPGHDDRSRDRSPAPDATLVPAPVPTVTPTRAPSPSPRRRPRTGAEGHTLPKGASTPAPSSSPTNAPALPIPRPPVLAPPALSIPSVSPVDASGQVRGAVSVIAISTALVAAALAIASLVLIRRSG
ncbi:MAG: hypothetical protein ACYDCS_08625 [Candidatus Dormibacteria bacterium]